jgi:hypothetical protein
MLLLNHDTCTELHCMYQHCNILGCNAAHSRKYYGRFDRRSVNMCKVTRSHVPEDGSLRSQLRISFVFVKRSISHLKPDVLQQKSIFKWLVRHLYATATHILCHLDPGRVFRNSFCKIHFNIVSTIRLVFSLHLFLPRLCMRYLSLPHVPCTSFFISFVAITLSAFCEEWSVVKSARIVKTKPWRCQESVDVAALIGSLATMISFTLRSLCLLCYEENELCLCRE